MAPAAGRRAGGGRRCTATWPRRRHGEEREILLALADAEERHAAHWATLLGDDVGPCAPRGTRMRLLAFLARRFGSVFVLALAQRAETRSPYDADADATPAMAADERIHEEVVRGLAARGRARVSGTFRAAVFGANDGLVSNLALVLGVSGGGVVDARPCCSPGWPGCWPARCRWVPASTSRCAPSASCSPPRPPTPDAAHRRCPHLDVDANELALVYRARGMPAEEADGAAPTRCCAATTPPARAGARLRATTTEHEVVGTGIGAALSSFCFFASGAAIPVLPFLFGLRGSPRWSSRPCWSGSP